MPSSFKPLPPMPEQTVQPINPSTGQWDDRWFAWLRAVERILREAQSKEP